MNQDRVAERSTKETAQHYRDNEPLSNQRRAHLFGRAIGALGDGEPGPGRRAEAPDVEPGRK